MNNQYLIEERSRDIGGFLVGRLLPFRKKRQVGPFTFIDHMGPSVLGPDHYFDVDQHPHIGLSTLTYLFEGEVHHRDSTGADQIIGPGDVGFMTSGRGVTHTERTPLHLRDGKIFKIHGYQVWVALPKNQEESEPFFQYFRSNELPEIHKEGLKIKVIAGEAFGETSPLQVFSPLYMLDIRAEKDTHIDLSGMLTGEIAFVVVSGEVQADGISIFPGQMLIAKSRENCGISVKESGCILVFGGEPFPEERYLYWNFVSSEREKIEKAKALWKDKGFPGIPGDDTYIPLP